MTDFKAGFPGIFQNRNLCFLTSFRILAFIFLFATDIPAQIVITSPVNNQVLQRDKNGLANIAVTGYAHSGYSRIELQFTPNTNNIHEGKTLSFPADQLKQGFLHATASLQTGWYRLKIIGIGDNGIADSATVARVGVGEVFLVAGNSNSMGLPDLGAKSANDQVVSFNAINKILNSENITVASDEPMQLAGYAPLTAKNNIFPTGETSWYWGEFGNLLSAKMNTPVLFLNAAWAAANSENYRDGAQGKDAFNLYVGKFWPNRQPYTNIVNTIRYFNSAIGLRAVLWAHGENDAQLNFTEDAYFSNIKILIENSRRDSGYPVPWIIARNSASFSLPKPFVPIINAQKRLAGLANFNTFPGPDLDTIQIPRPAHGHFENVTGGVQGLSLAANAWSRILTDSLFKNIPSLLPTFAIHAGLPPSKAFPGATFTLSYVISNPPGTNFNLQAELMDENGKFAAITGFGNTNPLNIKIPENIANGRYRIRLTATNPVLTGSATDYFTVNNRLDKIDFIHTITARKVDQNQLISWHVAANPQLARMILQKTTDGENYADLKSFDAAEIDKNSLVYAYMDTQAGTESLFYRIKLEDKNGGISYSSVLAILKDGTPPDYVVFPNPVTNQQFFIRPNEGETGIKCALFDMRGSEHPILISDNEVIGLLSVRPVHYLPAGIYIVKIISEAGVKSQTVLFN